MTGSGVPGYFKIHLNQGKGVETQGLVPFVSDGRRFQPCSGCRSSRALPVSPPWPPPHSGAPVAASSPRPNAASDDRNRARKHTVLVLKIVDLELLLSLHGGRPGNLRLTSNFSFGEFGKRPEMINGVFCLNHGCQFDLALRASLTDLRPHSFIATGVLAAREYLNCRGRFTRGIVFCDVVEINPCAIVMPQCPNPRSLPANQFPPR